MSANVCTASAHRSGRLRRSAGRRYRTTTGGFVGAAAAVTLRRALMWTAPEVASRIWSARARPLAPPMSAVSPVRSLLAAGPPGDLQHDRAAPARRRALPLLGCLPGWRVGCPATPETGPACPPTSAPRQPTVPVDCADRQADGIGQPPAASSAQPRQ